MDYRSVFARPPLFFSAAADAIELAVKESRFDHFFHYIDDFVLLGLPGSIKCERGLLCLQQVCENLGFFLVLSSLIRRSWCFGYLPKNLKGPSLSSLSGTRDAWAACWGMESLVCIMQHASTCCHRRRSSRQSQAKQRKPGGARIVGLVQLALEQGVYPETSPGEVYGCAPLVGCVRLMGMWRRLAGPVVSSCVGSPSHCIRQHRTEGMFPILVAGAVWGRSFLSCRKSLR